MWHREAGTLIERKGRGLETRDAGRRVIRLAFFVDSMHVGGTELNAVRTLERLNRDRFALTVFHMGAEGPLLERYRALGVPLYHVPVRGFLRPATVLAGVRFARRLRSLKIQVLHAHDIYSNIMAVPWARLSGVPAVVASKRWHEAVPSTLHARANALAERLATHVLANSEAVSRSLIDEDGVAPSRITVLPNFVTEDAFRPYPLNDRARILGPLGLPHDAVMAGVVARLSPVKDHAMFLRAAVRLVARNPQFHALLIGDGPLRLTLLNQIRDLGLGGRVHLLGELPNLPNPHGLFDISVLPSRTEGFPNSVIEAMAAGRPVVATSVGGTTEAVVDGVTGLLVPVGGHEALATAVQRLVDAPNLSTELGAAGAARAHQIYHVDQVLASLSDWYASMVTDA